MIYDKENFTAEKHEKAMEIYIKKLFGGGKELARPGPKSAAQTPAPPKERIKGSKENPEGTAATR